ncbi:MAG TPA: endonuclease III domain-containing protein [Candidatus Omnitrophota bacterium]|nr:endonuclease III domain-containing protein [Candidatus Omnitrophota bacterium]
MAAGVLQIYRLLYRYFGPQHWWPAETPFEVSVGAILTQNTSWVNVEKAIRRLREYRLLTPRRMFAVSDKKLAAVIRPAGCYAVKARRLRHFLAFLGPDCGTGLRALAAVTTSTLRRQLLNVNGIGPETADSILLFALNKPLFVVDGYTRRIFARHDLIAVDAAYDRIQAFCMRGLPREAKLFNEYHALLVRLGKDYCRKRNPGCARCPLKGIM